MSDTYEVAFRGEIAEGADLQQVRQNIGKMFKADDAKLDQLFSGKRIVIKKNIDRPTALKYQAAMTRAGAVCEVSGPEDASSPVQSAEPAPVPPAPAPAQDPAPAAARPSADYADRDIPPAPQTVPLDISGEQIADLPADLAPVGSMMQDQIEQQVAPPQAPADLTMAPVGTDLGEEKDKPAPPPPDTSGLTLADN